MFLASSYHTQPLQRNTEAVSGDEDGRKMGPGSRDQLIQNRLTFICDSVSELGGPQKQPSSAARVRPPSTVMWPVLSESRLARRSVPGRWREEGRISAQTVRAQQVERTTISSAQRHFQTPRPRFKLTCKLDS